MIERRWVTAVVAGLLLLYGILPLKAVAQAEAPMTTLVLDVMDARTRLPLAHARILLDGAQMRIGFSDAAGTVRFENLPTGTYEARVSLTAYQARTETLTVPLARPLVVTLTATRDLRMIGAVRARPVAPVDGSPFGATGGLAALAVTSTTPQQLGLTSGLGDALARITVDGAPLSPAGIPADPRGIDENLFAGVRGSATPGLDGSTQTLTLSAINPTVASQLRAIAGADSLGSDRFAMTSQGTAGETGFAFATSSRALAGPLDGASYADGAGAASTHHQRTKQDSLLAKIRAPLGSHTLSATVLGTNVRDDVICPVFSGVVPCGYGQGLRETFRSSVLVLTDQWKPGRGTVDASLYKTTTSLVDDQSSFTAGGRLVPFRRDERYSVSGTTISGQLRANQRLSFGGDLGLEHDTYASAQRSAVLDESVPSTSASTLRGGVQASYTVSPRLALLAAAGAQRYSQGGGSRRLVTLRSDLKASSNDTLAISASAVSGAGVAFNTNAARLTDPYHLSFDCTTGVARGRASGDAPGDGSIFDARFTAHHRVAAGDVAVALYRTTATGATLNVTVPASAIADTLPLGYLEAANSAYATVAGCGQGALPLGAVVLDVPVSGFRQTLEGATVGTALRYRALTVYAYGRVAVAKGYGNDPRLSASSTFISGAQLPGVPLHRAGLTLDYRPNERLEMLLDARYVSANAADNLPAHATLGAGVAWTVPRGTLSIGASNLLDTAAGNFTHPGGVPLATRSGPMLPTLAAPLSPRRVAISYTLRSHGASEDRTVRPGEDADVFETVLIAHPALTSASPPDALALHTTDERCDARAYRRARSLIGDVMRLARDIEARRGGSAYPAEMELPATGDVRATYRRTADAYALVVELASERDYEALSSCADVRAGNAVSAAALHLYVPDEPLPPRQGVIYSPIGGLYVVPSVPRSPLSFRELSLPSHAPADPFAVRADCPSEMRPEAVSLLDEIRAFVGGARGRLTQWAVTGAGTGFAFAVADAAKAEAVNRCGLIATTSEEEARRLSMPVVHQPRIGYDPARGLYTVLP